jgi:hypothetical protein
MWLNATPRSWSHDSSNFFITSMLFHETQNSQHAFKGRQESTKPLCQTTSAQVWLQCIYLKVIRHILYLSIYSECWENAPLNIQQRPWLRYGCVPLHFGRVFKEYFSHDMLKYNLWITPNSEILWPPLSPSFLKTCFILGLLKTQNLCYGNGDTRKVCGKVFKVWDKQFVMNQLIKHSRQFAISVLHSC